MIRSPEGAGWSAWPSIAEYRLSKDGAPFLTLGPPCAEAAAVANTSVKKIRPARSMFFSLCALRSEMPGAAAYLACIERRAAGSYVSRLDEKE
ncbi:MAG TPA: hypothetical protein VKV96_13175 [Roseiarcus sp.]|nr:hypothetical protein [Roseiarcus sp.]